MAEIPKDVAERLVELACFIQVCMRRARMESPLTEVHSARLGQGITAAERIEEIGRRVLNGRISKGGNGAASPCHKVEE